MRAEGWLRLAVCGSASVLVTCGARATESPPPESAPQARATPASVSPAPEGFDPGSVRPASGSPRAAARRALEEGNEEAAREAVARALATASPDEAARLRWLEATAAEGLGDTEGAAATLAAVAGSSHPLAPWAELRRAELLEERDPEVALTATTPLAARDWAGQRQARLVRARALVRMGQSGEAIPALRTLVGEAPEHVGAASAGMPLAELLADRGEPGDLEEAISLYRRIATRAPLAAIGARAQARAAALLATLPGERRRDLRELPIEDALVRARALLGAVAFDEAEQAFEGLAKRLVHDPDKRCEAELGRGRAILRRRDRDRAAALMEELAASCAATDVKAWARYYAGRAHAARGRPPEAIRQYEALEREAPDHRLADDALYRAALAARETGDEDGMRERLEALPDRYPDGDMRPRARFMLAWQARRRGDHEGALAHLEALRAEGPGEHAEDIVGRADYWRARTLAELDRRSDAVDAFARLVRRAPLSYYAQQALARLDEMAPDRADALRQDLRDGTPAAELRFPVRPVMQSPDFTRALELLRVGDIDRARSELHHLGLTGEGADPDHLWLVAALLDGAGAHPEASLLVRRRLASFRGTLPVGRAKLLWRIAYPRAFAPLIEDVAAAESVPAAFVRAVAREESAFDPGAISVAHARGLIQLMRPTAERFAKELGLPSDPASLHRPELNLRIGTRFIAYLWKRFGDNPAVIPAAYNAGDGAVRRWLRQRGDLPLDEWIEEIPYDETRRYSRRVLQTYGTYSWLDEGRLPALPRALPN